MYEILKIHTLALKHEKNVVEISTLSTIPEHLREAIIISDYRLWLDNVDGLKSAPLGSVIAYEKSRRTVSGYNCWSLGRIDVDIVKIDGVFYTKPHTLYAMLIPEKNAEQPLWLKNCALTYNGDGTASLKTANSTVSGRIGIDFILCHGLSNMRDGGKTIASILATYDPTYNDYIICDDEGRNICKLCELYPA